MKNLNYFYIVFRKNNSEKSADSTL